jgi:hypothetical protein
MLQVDMAESKRFPALYRVIQEVRFIFWEVILLVIVRKEIHMSMCVILNVHRNRAVWISRTNSVRFLFVGLDTRYELLALILDAAVHVKKSEDQLRQATRHLRTRVAKYTEFDVGIFEHLSWNVTNL